jgi:type I site-specific restriction-modification system R (restriction) subunit
MRKYISMVVIISFAAAFVLFACASGKKPAEEALKVAEQAVGQAKTEAGKIIPDQVSSLESALNGAKEKFTKGDYKAALAEAQAIPGKAKELLEAAKAKKEELTKTWNDLSQGLPKMIGAIKSRVDILSKSKKLPSNLNAEKFAEVKSKLSEAMSEWGVSQESFKGGDLADAVAKANSIKEKAVQMLQTLGMPVPQGAKS